MSEYESRLQNRAVKTFLAQRTLLPTEIFSQMFSELLDKIACGHYAFGGELCQKSLVTVPGICDLISILCDITSEEAIDLLGAEGSSFKVAFDEIIRKSVTSRDDEDGSEEKKS